MVKKGTKQRRPLILSLMGLLFAVALSFLAPLSARAVDPPATDSTAVAPTETATTPVNPNGTDPATLDPDSETQPADTSNTQTSADSSTPDPTSDAAAEDICSEQAGALAWFICPASGFFANAVDGIYGIIASLLTVTPILSDSDSAVYNVWEYIRNITNIVFIIFMVIVIFMQITGLGASKYNYTIKRALPRLAISAVVVNLSFIVTALAVDFSNILGHSLIEFFESIRNTAATTSTIPSLSWTELITALTIGGGVIFGVVQLTGGGGQIVYILIVALLCALIAVVIGLVVVAMRQALIYLLIMISPLAFVTYLLPNTEQYFGLWKKTFFQMLFFFPMFSILYGASELAGWVVMGFGGLYIILGLAIQVVPLILSISLLKMSGTVLGRVSTGLTKLTSPADAALRGWGANKRDVRRAEKLSRDMANHGDRLNPFSLSSWNAWRGYDRIKNAERIKTAEGNIANLGTENTNALKTGRRIIGRNHTGKPVYSSNPIRSNPWMRREAERRDIDNRTKGSTLVTENFHSTLSTQLKTNHISDRTLSERASNQIENYKSIRTAQIAAANNARSDERFYMDLVRKAAEKGPDSDEYHRLIANGAGADYYNNDSSVHNNAVNAVIANAYTSYEKERQEAVKRTQVYMDKLKTYDLKKVYKAAWDNKDIDSIVAANQILAFRGDYDEIMKQAMDHMDQKGYAMLGSDFTNTLASSFMSMKNAAPVLGRFGKHINLETAHYTFEDDPDKKRCEYVTMKEYFTGQDDNFNDTKRSITDLLTGTPIDGIDRTAFAALQDGIDRYFTKEYLGSDVAAEARKAKLDKEMLSDVIGGTLKFGNKSEPMFTTLKYYTGLTIDQKDNVWYGDAKHHTPGEKNENYYKATKMFLSDGYSNVQKLASMKSSTYNACIARLEIENGINDHKREDYASQVDYEAAISKVRQAAISEFRQIFADNGVLDAATKSKNSGAIASMDINVRKALGLFVAPSKNTGSSPSPAPASS